MREIGVGAFLAWVVFLGQISVRSNILRSLVITQYKSEEISYRMGVGEYDLIPSRRSSSAPWKSYFPSTKLGYNLPKSLWGRSRAALAVILQVSVFQVKRYGEGTGGFEVEDN